MFVTSETDEQGNILCKECSEKNKTEQEQIQKQKEELEYKTKLAKALSTNPQWEYKVLNLKIEGSEEELTKMGLEGWNLVSAVGINSSTAAKQEENPGEQKQEIPEGGQQQPPPQPPKPEQPQTETTTSTEGMVCIFKRKL